MLRYLHLSDFHLKRKNDDPVSAFNQDMVTRSMLDMVGSLKKPDFVIITGDLAHGGKPEEYDVAEVFCNRLLEAAELDRQRLFLVPGNHDVSRKDVRSKHIKSIYPFDTQEDITETLTDPDIFPILMRKFAGFGTFVEKIRGRRLSDKSEYWFAETLTLTKEGQEHRISLLGLNSCLFAGYDGDEDRKLALGLHQVEPALGKLDKNALSIGFFHHPFFCFHPEDEVCQNLLTRELDLILTGHLHKPSNAFTRNAAGQAVIIGAGASYEARESRNSFNVTEIDPDTGRGKVQFYKYLPEYHVWKKDTDINPAVDDGSFSFTVERLSGGGADTDFREEDQPDGVTPEKAAEKKGDVITIHAGGDVIIDKSKAYQVKNSQVGIVGDHASVKGGIHFGNGGIPSQERSEPVQKQPAATDDKSAKVFVSYAREDVGTAGRLYDDLRHAGVTPWMDKKDILPGQNWKVHITKAIWDSKYFIVLLSSGSLSKRGFVQKELRMALDILDEFPDEDIFIIPVRLDECEPSDERLKNIRWTDLFPSYDEGLSEILRVLAP
ncbi:TIR domain-containing protein [Desulfobacterales bacterium HSG2]|nr:TIR domain-containing protein [Desulfobacterales bacterium HSG2]